MHIADAAGDRVLDRDHAEIGIAVLDGGEGILEARAGHDLGLRKDRIGRLMREGAEFALEGDALGREDHGRVTPVGRTV